MKSCYLNLARMIAISVLFVGGSGSADGQFKNGNQTVSLDLPQESQGAQISQRIGLTVITVTYHRPEVKGRQIWGKVVP